MSSKELDFKDLIDPSLWKDYDSCVEGADKELEKDIEKSIIIRKQIRENLLNNPQLKQKIRPKAEE